MKIIIVRKGNVAMKRIAVLTSGGDSPGMNALLEQSYEKQFIIISKFWCLSGLSRFT